MKVNNLPPGWKIKQIHLPIDLNERVFCRNVRFDDILIEFERYDMDYNKAKNNIIKENKMDFGQALQQLKLGKKVARSGWNGKNMFLFLVAGSTFKVNRHPLLGIYPDGTEINYRSHIDMRTADGEIVPWVASQSDILSDDWEVIS